MIPGTQPKLEASVQDSRLIFREPIINWTLIRQRDGLIKESMHIKWLEWNEDDTFKDDWDNPEVGFSLIMSPFNEMFTWQTTEITELIDVKPNYVEFKTKNSHYKLYKK